MEIGPVTDSVAVADGGVAGVMTPTVVLLAYLAMSMITYASYARDKSAARAARRRTPEKTLHLMALLGGWPGALLAQRRLRHKSSKTSFLVTFWLTVVVNLALLAWAVSGGWTASA